MDRHAEDPAEEVVVANSEAQLISTVADDAADEASKAGLKKTVSLLDAELPMPPTRAEHDELQSASQQDPFATKELGNESYRTVEIGHPTGSQFDSQMAGQSQFSNATTSLGFSQFSNPYGSQIGGHSSGSTGTYNSHPLPHSQAHSEVLPGAGACETQPASHSTTPAQIYRASMTGSQPLPPTMFVHHSQISSPWLHHPLAHMHLHHRASLPVTYSAGDVSMWGEPPRPHVGMSSFNAAPSGAEFRPVSPGWAYLPVHPSRQMVPAHALSQSPYYIHRASRSMETPGVSFMPVF